MKPNFALTLSFEGIGLLHRAFPGWHMVDEVSLQSDDLAGDLVQLRDAASRLDKHPIHTKLVIPNDQIRYLSFDSDGLGPDEIADAVHRALDGATPYAVDDLAYDWSIGAGQVHIAAVARETLSEAEAFAADHGFNPLCFVAIPEGRDFVGEPWFGQTKTAESLLPEGGHVDRDTAAIRVIGTASLPNTSATETAAPPPTTSEDTASPETTADATEKATAPQPEDSTETPLLSPEPPNDAPAAPEDEGEDTNTETSEAPEVEPASEPEPEPAPASDPEPAPEQEPEPASEPTPEPEAEPTAPAASEESAAPLAFNSIRARRDDVPAAAPRLSGATRSAENAIGKDTAAPKEDTRTEPPLTSAAPAPPDTADQITGRPQDALPTEAAARIGATLRPTEADRMAAPGEDTAPDNTDNDTDIPPPPAFMANAVAVDDDLNAAETDIKTPAAGAPDAAPSRAPSFFTRRKSGKPRLSLRPAARDRQQPPDHEHEKQRMTVFGARKPAQVGGKPRFLGLILTAVLLIFLVGVAAWASIFLEDGIARLLRDGPNTEDTQTANTPSADVPDLSSDTANAPDPVEGDETVIAALPGVTSDVEDTPREARPAPDPAVLTEPEARTRYAVTGIWQRAPDAPNEPAMQSLDDFYQTSIDPKVLEQDAVALPDPRSLRADPRPDTPAPPPAADTMFSMDTRGLVRATPNGALTPEGVRIYAGRPALVPPQRPAETLDQPADDPASATAETNPGAERLASIRPRARPGDLAETNERETLGGRTRNELALIRPKLRPQSAQERAEETAAAAAADVTPDPDAVQDALQEAAAVQTPDPFAGATAQAVKVSVKPTLRPRNFDRIVTRSQRQAEQQETRTAAVAVPRNQRIKPSGPTPTTVARAATEKNALRLKRVNLIGVYGTSSNRRALVRLANGRYKKVKVGDRLDGGRVAAIGTSELRYVKSGRSVTLTMPRG